MKIEVGQTYIDGIGCTVKIIYKMDDSAKPFVGIVSWKTAKDKNSHNGSEDCEQYAEDGKAYPAGGKSPYDLIKLDVSSVMRVQKECKHCGYISETLSNQCLACFYFY